MPIFGSKFDPKAQAEAIRQFARTQTEMKDRALSLSKAKQFAQEIAAASAEAERAYRRGDRAKAQRP